MDTLRLGLPLGGAALAQLAMSATDTVLLGRIGPEALAAGGLGASIALNVQLVLQGVVGAAGVSIAQSLGARSAGRPAAATGGVVGSGAVLAALLCLPAIAALSVVEPALLAIGEAPALAHDAGRFAAVLRWGVPGAMLGLGLLRAVLPAIGAGWIILPVTVVAAFGNLGLGIALIHGLGGLPALGLIGPGVATAIINTAMALALAALACSRIEWRTHLRPSRPRPAELAAILRLGLPIGAIFAVETGLFLAAALLVGLLGATALAAQQIALSVVSLAFMIPLGLSQAANVRVGRHTGAGDRGGARAAGLAAISLGAGFELLCAAASWLLPAQIVGFYTDAGDTAREAVALLQVAALFQVADGVQCVAAGALRGAGDTRVPFLLAAAGYWAVGLPLAWALALHSGLGARGAWWGLAAGLTVTAALLLTRFLRRTAPGAA